MTNFRMWLGASALVCIVSVLGFAQEVAEYQPLMKAGAASNGALRKTAEGGDLAAAADHAAAMMAAFAEIEQFWAKRGVADAQQWAKNVMAAAGEAVTAAKAGNQDGVMAAVKNAGANCQSCHQAHRDKGADGQFVIK